MIMLKSLTKKDIIYLLIFAAFIILGSLGCYKAINIRAERNKLKTSLKAQEKIYKELDYLYTSSIENEEGDQADQKNYFQEYQREKNLRIQHEKTINIFVNYNNKRGDSIVSNYKFKRD